MSPFTLFTIVLVTLTLSCVDCDMTSDFIIYSPSELLGIRNSVTNNHHFRTIDPFTCATIKALRLTKRKGRCRKSRRRGKRGGKHIRQLKDIHISVRRDGIDIQFLLLNARSIKSKEFLIREEIDSTDAEFVVLTCKICIRHAYDHCVLWVRIYSRSLQELCFQYTTTFF